MNVHIAENPGRGAEFSLERRLHGHFAESSPGPADIFPDRHAPAAHQASPFATAVRALVATEVKRYGWSSWLLELALALLM
jgi:hypothetical protein